MKKVFALIFLLMMCLLQTTAFAVSISDDSENGVKMGILEDVAINQTVTGSVIAIFGNADIQSDVSGDVIVIFGDATINSNVKGSVVGVWGTVKLGEQCKIAGDLMSVGNTESNDNAVVQGFFRTVDLGGFDLGLSKLGILVLIRMVLLIIFVVFVLLIGFPLLMVFTERFQNLSEGMEYRLGKRLLIGIPGVVLAYITFILLGVTGIVPIIYFIYAIFIEVIVSIFLGKMVIKVFNGNKSIYVQFITGFILFIMLKAGILIWAFADQSVAGFGVSLGFDFILSAFGTGILLDSKFAKKNF